MLSSLQKSKKKVIQQKNLIIEQFIETWVAVTIKPGEGPAAAKQILTTMRLCTKLEGMTHKFWLEFKDPIDL